MLLIDIAEEIMERTGHVWSMQSIIRKVDALQRDIFRRYCKTPTTSREDLEKGNALYPLPCPWGALLKVVVNGKPYDFLRVEGQCEPYYYQFEKSVGLVPTPEADVPGGLMFFHRRTPRPLSINDLSAEPDLDADYRMLLVDGVSADVVDDPVKERRYRERYDRLLQNFKVANLDPEPPIIRVER